MMMLRRKFVREGTRALRVREVTIVTRVAAQIFFLRMNRERRLYGQILRVRSNNSAQMTVSNIVLYILFDG